jgi:protease II
MLLTSRLVQRSLPQLLRGIASLAAGTSPVLPAISETVEAYGHTWQDEYHWIQSQPLKIEGILRQEAEYFHHVAHCKSSIAAVSSQLRAEIQNLLPHQTASVGEVFGGWEYVSEQSKTHPLPVYSRRRSLPLPTVASEKLPQVEEKEILLDINELEHLYGEDTEISIGQIKLSKCGNLVACTVAENGVDDLYSVVVRDVTTGEIYPQPALKGVVSIEWDGDNETLFATQPDELGRPARVICTTFSRKICMNKSKTRRRLRKKYDGEGGQRVEVVYEEKDPRFFLELQRSKDWNYLMINSNSKTSSEVWIFAASDGSGGGGEKNKDFLTCVQPRRPGLEYFLEHLDGKLYIISNARNNGHNYDLYSVDVDLGKGAGAQAGAMNEKYWKNVVLLRNNSTGNDVFIEDLDVNHNGIVLYQRSCATGKPEIEIIPIDSLKNNNEKTTDVNVGDNDNNDGLIRVVSSYRPELPEYAWSITPGANADFFSDTLRIMVASPVHPDQPLDWNLKYIGQQLHQKWVRHDLDKEESSVLGHDPDAYTLEKAWAPILSSIPSQKTNTTGETPLGEKISNNAAVPISLIYPKSLDSTHSRQPKPCLVVVYASYGINVPTDFLLERIPLLQRGWTIALVHARGGGELGRPWHAAGRGPIKKPNSALDIESAVEYLIDQGYTAPGSIALEATSAGAVAAGGVLNHRPELFGAVLLESPFVDVLSTMINPELPLTVHEYEEFGDPSTEEGMHGLKKICPYYNIKKDTSGGGGNDLNNKIYPPVLVTCSSTDARVPIWGPLKYAAKLRAASGDDRGGGVGRGSVLVYADAHGGHLPDDREKYDLKAVQYAFLLDAFKQVQLD